MKKILILAAHTGDKKQQLTDFVNTKLKGQAVATLALFSDIVIEVNGQDIQVQVGSSPISEFDLIIYRGVKEFSTLAGTLAICLTKLKIDYTDTAFSEIGCQGSKLTSLIKIALNGLPSIPTFFCWRNHIVENYDYLIKKFGLPLIAKELTKQRGEGVILIRSKADFQAIEKWPIESQFMFQSFFPNDGDFRLLVLGDEVAVYEKKVRTDVNEFRNNVARGSKEVFLDIKTIPEDMKQMAISAARAEGYQIAGVDILIDSSTGKKWILEVNRGPAFTYDTKVSPELQAFTDFIAKKLKLNSNA